jgi:Protein of unknown function (DUF1579)
MEMPKPTDGHRKLQKMVGRWEGTETMHPSQWDPKGGTAIGRNHMRLDLNGFAVIGDYRQERDGATTFAGHSVLTYDPGEDVYVMHWFDSMGTPPEIFKGRFEGTTLTLSSKNPQMQARMTYDLSRENTLHSRMEMSPDGKQWKTFFDATYEKK